MKLKKAYEYLAAVQAHKRCIPFRVFNGGVGRTGQANEFGTSQGARRVFSLSLLCLGHSLIGFFLYPYAMQLQPSTQNS